MRFILIYLVCFGSLDYKAQTVNYVSNPSFELTLPTVTTTLSNAANYWSSFDSTICGSYLIMCKPPIGTAPYCSFGFQFPKSGGNMALTTFYQTDNSRWYPRNILKQNLKQNVAYCAKYYVVNTNNNRIAIDSYGMYFSDSSFDTITTCYKPLTYLNPQIEYTNGIITDTLNWIAISGTFVATGNEKYLVLGNFRSNAATNTLLINTPLTNMTNDVYIDDVSVIELNLPAFAGRDTSVIPGDSVFLGRESDIGIDEACMWYKLPTVITPTTPAIDTIAGFWVKPITSCTYVVRQEICGLVKWDTVIVHMNPLGIEKLKFLNEELKLFPIPAKDELHLSIFNAELLKEFHSISIYNNLGLLVSEIEVNFENGNSVLNTEFLANGVYSLQLKNNTNEIICKRFVIAR